MSTISGNIVWNQVETDCCDCYYNIGNGVCPIFETGDLMLYPEKKDKSSQEYYPGYQSSIRIIQFDTRSWLKSQPFSCPQRYIYAIEKVSGRIVQNQKPPDRRKMCHDCFCNIRKGVCPKFGTYITIFHKDVKQNIKFLNEIR